MARPAFRLEGAAELQRKLREFGPRFVNNTSGRALRAGAKPITTIAKEKVPVRTGALKKSIATRLRRMKHGGREIEIGFKKPVSSLAHLVEFGTVHAPAQPFIRPALDEGAGAAFTAMTTIFRIGIEKEAIARGDILPDDSDASED